MAPTPVAGHGRGRHQPRGRSGPHRERKAIVHAASTKRRRPKNSRRRCHGGRPLRHVRRQPEELRRQGGGCRRVLSELSRRRRSGGRPHGEQRLRRHAAVRDGGADAAAAAPVRHLGGRQAAGARHAAHTGVRDAAQRHQPAVALPPARSLDRGRGPHRDAQRRPAARPCRAARRAGLADGSMRSAAPTSAGG